MALAVRMAEKFGGIDRIDICTEKEDLKNDSCFCLRGWKCISSLRCVIFEQVASAGGGGVRFVRRYDQ